MLAPTTLIQAYLVTIAEPDDSEFVFYLQCAVCGECFADGDEAYVIGTFPGAYLHICCS